MKINIRTTKVQKLFRTAALCGGILFLNSCEKGLDYKTYGDLNTVITTPEGVSAAVTTAYTGLAGGSDWQGGWDAGTYAWRTQAMMTTDEGVCAWANDWIKMHTLNFTPDFDWVTHNYTRYLPFISRIAITLEDMKNINMDQALKSRLEGELKALRAHYAEMLYFAYGPLTIVTDAKIAADPNAAPVPRPTNEEMVKQIEKDFLEAADVLPAKFTGLDYGRFSKAAALTGLMKLYMHEKQWAKAVETGNKLKTLGYSLQPKYEDLFSIANKGGASTEIILAVVCVSTGTDQYTNMWLAHALPTDYKDPSGINLTAWGGYKMRWTSYDKFDKQDKRLSVLLESYPSGKDASGNVTYTNARTSGQLGAVPMKFAPDPSKANAQNSAIDFPIYRYADVLLMLAESINEANGGPNTDAYEAVNLVRSRAGLGNLLSGLNKAQFLAKIQDERLFELWAEGWRRDDLIRWNLFTKRAADDGSTTAESFKVLYPLPRAAVTQSNGIIKQNAGYN
ncbi:RagB/SusD family nutrient uptake outer membrane protein [Pedobacter ginsengisoli]|uniref:RagB/SusD family nutrient uptake outer membrane protein n=1 Tax=Pedobacter ginsengisoli TaxID=363852 RepID=A0A2D1U758_9SPHI|nr:RagB/SusD family nutrient uptake outer membrane protein [Pedobacter ginsengisoli]ATP57384.1 RagB/SusD family nutrient uptake outer membrane protein [Pedobacter ginsengisoli]